jgi:hypothetical protein
MMMKLILLLLFVLVGCKDQVSGGKTIEVLPVQPCEVGDDLAPIMQGTLSLADDASKLNAPTVSWVPAQDNCDVSHYELMIGTSLGGDELLVPTNIGKVTSHQQSNLSLDYGTNYYLSVRAVDGNGNVSAYIHAGPWQLYSPQSLGQLVVWLDASESSSISDKEGDHPGDVNFDQVVKTWSDISQSSAIHNFTAGNSNLPQWNNNPAVTFNGATQFMATADHVDINLGTTDQRTITMAFQTGSDVASTQVLFEEGGTVRGLNIYIDNGSLYCGFWNDTNDGDQTQPFISSSGTIAADTKYTVSLILDYSNYNGPNGVDGVVDCQLNGNSLGTVSTTSRLYPHSGDIGLGAVNQHTYLHTGSSSSSNALHFEGEIYEFQFFNRVHSVSELSDLQQRLSSKWGI